MFHIIILNWNGISDTSLCIHSILKSGEQNYRICVVDNNSNDNEFETLKERFGGLSDIEVLQTWANLGFSGGNNFGLANIFKKNMVEDSDFVLFLNNDTEVWPWFLSAIESVFQENPNAWVVQSALVYYDNPNIINNYGIEYSKNGLSFEVGNKKHLVDFPESIEYENIMLASACSMAIPVKVIRELLLNSENIELWNNDYFLYWEDVDLSLRIRHAGYSAYVARRSLIKHKVGISTKKLWDLTLFHAYKNMTQVYMINFTLREFMKMAPYIIIMELLSIPYTIIQWKLIIWLKAKYWLLMNFSKIMNKRRLVLSMKKRSIYSELILKWRPQE